jgi:predicted RNA-binding Zn ribbon-like protein
MTAQMWDASTAKKFQFVGGNLALDYCNTMGGRRGVATTDHLGTCFDYLAWCHQAGLLDKEQAGACATRAEQRPKEAAAVLAHAVELREALFRILAACIAAKAPPRSDLALLNAELAGSLGRLSLSSPESNHVFAWKWNLEPGALDQLAGFIAHAAAALLTDEQALTHLSICQSETCGWLFIDKSKNHSRRWCDMRDCGNRAKIRRHRLKQTRSD